MGQQFHETAEFSALISAAAHLDGDLHAWNANRAVLLGLLDRIGTLDDPRTIMAAAAEVIGQHLKVAHVGYAEVTDGGRTLACGMCWAAEGGEPYTGSIPMAYLGDRVVEAYQQGRTIVVTDARSDPLATPFWAASGVMALVGVPMMRDGDYETCLFVVEPTARIWEADEIRFVQDISARTWDVVKRTRAEEALRLLNASLGRQVETRTRERDRTWRLAPVLMVIGDSSGTLLECNPAWTRVLGWTPDETIGHDVMEFVAPEDREVGAAGMEQLFQGVPVIEYQNTFLTRTGERRRIAWTTVPEGGLLYGYGRDITDQLLAEERLRQAQKMEAIGQLTGGLAHDFNNLLTGMTGSLELLQMRLAQGRVQELEHYVKAAQGAARRAAALTHRLLAFSRQQSLDPKPTDVNHLIAEMEDLIRRTIGPALDMTVSGAPDLWTALVDPHQLENALLNLCINARDAMPDGGRLTIATANLDLTGTAAREQALAPGQYLSLSVRDTGTGMTPEVMRRAFDPFFTTKPLGAGTGLGLSMIYGFAQQSGGQVRIESEEAGGTTVCIYLPRHVGQSSVADTAVTVARAWRGGQGETVLVVDDEADVRSLVSEVLGDLGYAAIEAADGPAGLRVLRSGTRVDLLVTDVGLPGGMNGRQLADAGREVQPDLRVLFITGYAENIVAANGYLDPGMRVLTKPFVLDALADCIRDMITGV